MIGCYKARTVPVNLNYRYVAPELRYVIDNADLEVLVYERDLAQLVADSLDGDPPTVRSTWWSSRTAPPRRRRPGRPRPAPPHRYEDALAAAGAGRGFGPRSPDDLYVLYTGGTTGMPKGVMWRQEDIFFAAMGGGGWGAEPITTADEFAGRLNPTRRHACPCWWWPR